MIPLLFLRRSCRPAPSRAIAKANISRPAVTQTLPTTYQPHTHLSHPVTMENKDQTTSAATRELVSVAGVLADVTNQPCTTDASTTVDIHKANSRGKCHTSTHVLSSLLTLPRHYRHRYSANILESSCCWSRRRHYWRSSGRPSRSCDMCHLSPYGCVWGPSGGKCR